MYYIVIMIECETIDSKIEIETRKITQTDYHFIRVNSYTTWCSKLYGIYSLWNSYIHYEYMYKLA